MHMILREIARIEAGQRYILGVDGLSRSGKTTLVTKLKQCFLEENIAVFVFHIDDYIVERKRRYNTDYEQWHEYYHLQWDVEWLKENFFKQLSCGEILSLSTYDDLSDTHDLQEIKTPKTGLIIVEGVFLQRKEWRSYFDYIIYFDCPRETRFKREKEETQQDIEKFRHRYWKAEDYYLETELPLEKADLIIQC
ncbi:kinase [Heyndrickxia camelliae]|uniref:Uridine kinase n=1 Tax=Heyndrickxia camelliae TaxID=1707093 RepID=A0A2N3LGS0_9BACI|nr:kinase [Heyndrickxia camelliae]PKR83830.1 uridine kinase [Heyndrickxia camelliae]